jgi:hypothetical protein
MPAYQWLNGASLKTHTMALAVVYPVYFRYATTGHPDAFSFNTLRVATHQYPHVCATPSDCLLLVAILVGCPRSGLVWSNLVWPGCITG